MTPIRFIHDLRFADLSPKIVARAKLCLLDLIGTAAAGLATDLSRIVRDHAVRHLAAGEGRGVRLLLDGRRASPGGAALAGAFTIDAFDAHDGHALTKGHAGVVILPALLAAADGAPSMDGREFLLNLVLGYEIATRAGIALHASVPDYHTSGAWNALACAAVTARVLGLDAERTRHALGIAEYHGPRSQMMRVIDHPTMLKDGSGWGALAGVSAAYLAEDGFTGAPAITVEAPAQAALWGDLGRRWYVMEQYFKPHPVCRWAQPAIEAALTLVAEAGLEAEAIEAVEVATFANAVALGASPPATTEEAQYAIGFPLAAALVRGRVGAGEITGAGLADPDIARMLGRITLVEDPGLTARFPAERLARLTVRCTDGRVLYTPDTAPRGNPESPLPPSEIEAKFHDLAACWPRSVRDEVAALVGGIDGPGADVARLLDLVLAAPEAARGGIAVPRLAAAS